MNQNLENKLKKLKAILTEMGSVIVAYSGGVDSTLVLKVAVDTLGKNTLAVTANSQTYPKEELKQARKMAKKIRTRHLVIHTHELKNPKFSRNPINRCYFCKKELFGRLKDIAQKNKFNYCIDATNLDDAKDFRPGNQAKKEFNIRSPLKEAGFTKEDIRQLSKRLGLATWNKPSLACLASRIPYYSAITKDKLKRIEKAESFLRDLGFKQVRIRHHNGICRIEVAKNDISKIANRRSQIAKKLKRLGYNYITLDLEGYRTGSMNETVLKKHF